ncbi:SDR family oxidoreductase [Mesorhizobium sp. M1C.F.Ca.ET.193.01.1.1]|nr:SDR family oxidoreductase [Mesorhizobium sp. M3A.F.Ca.ET.080.04.2.1]RWA58219.1 MAG: SDR family oxidoreductase [Mesorhizobium sp.]TGQ49635.1 SDR family oxidoreductase [Mesorhizobium sp. M1C.F.Ca.ET.210.01.1.1]TGQ62596.1 SDR family oxidoreductase [bacterium M00.F.Ca.ET.205.01.1.1]TGQ63710.1 SDR family oxidoreductase [Mesorhizobium sp. M1C.F.Ca.ET.212.01.1.1]TGQ97422.1 SDR family oxidoreductase [Mesorhizobium sp. M1C.F.Ca.ET.204.01.1.1]TGR17451.1 SDR family oxidoreductase [Mesorhizobium sp. M
MDRQSRRLRQENNLPRLSFGGIDILCASAGIFPQTKLVDLDPAEWDRVMATNLKSAFLSSSPASYLFREGGQRVP